MIERLRARGKTGALAAISCALPLALAACDGGGTEGGGVPGNRADTHPYAEIGPDEAVHLTGTEPFWGGDVTGGALLYKTVEAPDGVSVPVSRFAGRGGLSFSGTLDGKALTLAVTPGDCSDGMSDRKYPFVATLQLGDETRSGCAWAKKHPFSGPKAP
jgi:uncharacterized membrane protein